MVTVDRHRTLLNKGRVLFYGAGQDLLRAGCDTLPVFSMGSSVDVRQVLKWNFGNLLRICQTRLRYARGAKHSFTKALNVFLSCNHVILTFVNHMHFIY